MSAGFAQIVKVDAILTYITLSTVKQNQVMTSVFSSSELKRWRAAVFLSRTPKGWLELPSGNTELAVGGTMEKVGLSFIGLSQTAGSPHVT